MPSAIMDPTGRKEGERKADFALAPRRGDITGARVGLLENGKQNAALFLEEVGGVLKERYGISDVMLRRKDNFSAPVPPELLEEMHSECDVVVIGVGD
jgi:hypothetical protein